MHIQNEELWLVIRTDSNNNTFLMQDGLTKAAADSMVHTFALRAHRQTYEAIAYTAATKKAIIAKRHIEL